MLLVPLAFMVPFVTVRVPATLRVEAGVKLVVPPVKLRPVPDGMLTVPLMLLLPWRLRVPVRTLTVPGPLRAMLIAVVPLPADLRIVPVLLMLGGAPE